MFQLVHGRDGFTAHVFNGVVVAQPVRAFDRVVHMPNPIVLGHVAKCGTHTALGGNGMAARGKHFGNAGCFQAVLHHAERGAQASTASTHNHDVIVVINDLIARR